MKQFAFLLVLIPLLGSCVAAPFAAPFVAAAAIGAWTAGEYADRTGSISMEAAGQDVWLAARAVALDHAIEGKELDINDGVRRIEGRLQVTLDNRVQDATVLISILPFTNIDNATEIKVTAIQGARGRVEIAQMLAEEIANRL